MARSVKSTPYDLIAQEYYNERHITSRNFDLTTISAFKKMQIIIPDHGLVLEFGAGRGRANQFLNIKSNRIVQSDLSEKMLSIADREECLLKILCDATDTPFFDEQFSLSCAFLCDPYYSLEFLIEAYRITKTNGYFIATLPSSTWGNSLRDEINIRRNETKFLTDTKQEIFVPSFLATKEQILSDLHLAGFKEKYIDIFSWKLPEEVTSISPHILLSAELQKMSPYSIDLIDIVIARKL